MRLALLALALALPAGRPAAAQSVFVPEETPASPQAPAAPRTPQTSGAAQAPGAAAPAAPEAVPPAAPEAVPPAAPEAVPPAAPEAVPPAAPAPQGPIVAAVEVRSEVPLDTSRDLDLDALLDLPLGEPLTDLRVRRTLRNFQASGIAEQVELYTEPAAWAPAGAGTAAGAEGAAPPAVTAIVVLRPATRVADVRVEGELGLGREDLLGVVEQGAGQPLAEDRVLRSIYRLQDLYRENGYFLARVRPRITIDEARRLATVVFEVTSGPRATIGTISFDGTIAPYREAELLERLRVGGGAAYRQDALADDAERLQSWLLRQHHNLARVEPPREHVNEAKTRVDLTYPIDVGPRLEVAVVGADAKKLRRRGLLPFLEEEGYDEALVLQSVAKIKDYYQQQGHYHVQVDSSEQRQDGVLKLTLTIDPGPQYTLTEVDFEGNQGIRDEQLAELMAVSPKRLLALGSGRLVDSELDKDLDNIRSYYALQGYAQAEVGTPQVYESGSSLRLVIPIDEGPRQQVGQIRFQGLTDIDLAEVRRRMPLKERGPFHPVLLESALNAVRAEYADAGFLEAQVSASQAWSPDRGTVDLTFEAIPGAKAVADRIIVRGNERTLSEVIRRSAGVERGDAVSNTGLLEVERNLYRLGIFSRVDAELTRVGLAAGTRDVVIRVQEGKPRRLTYGVGYDSENGARGLFGFTHNNVGGRAYSLVTDLRLSQRDQRARVIFDQPYLGRLAVPLTSSLFYLKEDDAEAGVDTRRWGGRSEASKILGKTRYGLAFDYRVVRADLADGVALNNIERESRPLQIASVIPNVQLDHRDDPVLPSRGFSSLVQTQYSFPALGSQAEFLKLFVQHTQYLRLGRFGVFAASARAGGIEPFQSLAGEDPDLPSGLPNADVFISERFFLGGSTTHRAYGRDRLGILGQTLFPRDPEVPGVDIHPVGGNGLLLFNFDLRFPIAGPVGGTVFYDLGNVWAGWRDVDLVQLKGGVGVGLRYISPIGPLRVEAGWKLDRESFESARPVVFLSFGNPF